LKDDSSFISYRHKEKKSADEKRIKEHIDVIDLMRKEQKKNKSRENENEEIPIIDILSNDVKISLRNFTEGTKPSS
jgi:hypothetical protein